MKNLSKEAAWNVANMAATAAGKKGVPVPPKGSKARKDLALAEDREAEKKRRRVVYTTCPHCEAGFPVETASAPLPPHRAFRGTGQCPGTGKPGEK